MPTIDDIAEIAKVSKSTVSRALKDSYQISEARKKEIQEIAFKIGYFDKKAVNQQKKRKNKTVGLIAPTFDRCNYYRNIIGSVERNSKKLGYALMVAQTNYCYEDEIYFLKLFSDKQIDGLLMCLYNKDQYKAHYEIIKKMITKPVIYIDTSLDLTDKSMVSIDYSLGVDLAIGYLHRLKHEKIIYLGQHIADQYKLENFKNSMKNYGISYDDGCIYTGEENLEYGGYVRMKEVLKDHKPPFAMFVSHDTMANGAMKAIMEAGYSIPEDISMVSYGNNRESEYFPVPLTTISHPVEEMGQIAVNLLVDEIENPMEKSKQHILLKPTIIIRDSAMEYRNP
ncbi:LacI family DNA-binding transcriptional regulator [Clostridium sp. MCC353]|uniref:LacI family DNA-binding transcriptional regulator n=1 Tax=Clostridium sp. MCC353 TaxID=2592646 RepID=UPI001C00CB3C|nr:LacI family DNA-binding transcriptional regulator [Clostridium sp. MCC353]MBT9778168.1 LacI family DNA-binding transcriptional regulator [Clostridium sp. MCC353]